MTNKVVVQKVVGNVSIRGEASSDRRDISMQDLLDIASKAAGNEGEVTGREGVNLTITMSGPDAPAEPLFTPAEEPRPRGVSYGQITKAEEVKKQEEAERRHIEAREDRVSIFRANVRRSVIGYEMTAEGFSKALEAAICNAANHFRSLLDEMNRNMTNAAAARKQMSSTVLERNKTINEYIEQVSKLNEEISAMAKSFDGERSKLHEQISEYQRRLNVIRSSLDAIENVI